MSMINFTTFIEHSTSREIVSGVLYCIYRLQRLIDSRQTHLSLVFMHEILMKFSVHCRGDLHLKSHFYEGQDNLFLEG